MPRLFLLPGLGADERMFETLGAPGLSLTPARLPVPEPDEPMPAYSLRVAARLQLRPEDWLGGASFGGLVAADIARRRPLGGLVLIGGALNSNALTGPAPLLGKLVRFMPLSPLRALLSTPTGLSVAFGPLAAPQARLLTDMLAATPDGMLREGGRLATGYFPGIPPLCRAHAIHGARDRLMRPPALPGCRMIADGGHGIAITHAREVSAFLQEILC